MNRREQREQIFKILFGVEFHSADELEEQIGLYMEDLGDILQKRCRLYDRKGTQYCGAYG